MNAEEQKHLENCSSVFNVPFITKTSFKTGITDQTHRWLSTWDLWKRHSLKKPSSRFAKYFQTQSLPENALHLTLFSPNIYCFGLSLNLVDCVSWILCDPCLFPDFKHINELVDVANKWGYEAIPKPSYPLLQMLYSGIFIQSKKKSLVIISHINPCPTPQYNHTTAPQKYIWVQLSIQSALSHMGFAILDVSVWHWYALFDPIPPDNWKKSKWRGLV